MTEVDPSSAADPDPAATVSHDALLGINFAVEAGKQMLESSTSVSEVIDRLRRFLPAIGLGGCSVDADMGSVTVSHWEPGQAVPLTMMRDLEVSAPRLQILSGTEALLDRVEAGEIDLDSAFDELRSLVSAPPQKSWTTRGALLLAVFGWVTFLDGLGPVTVLVAFLATALTFPIERLVRLLQLPVVAVTFFVAVIVAAIPNLLAAAGLTLLVGSAVVASLYIYLPGRALVSSVIDGLANSPLSSLSRGIEALLTAGFLALGMLVGNKIGAGLGLDYTPDVSATPLVESVAGAAIGVLGIAIAWAMPRAQLAPTVLIGAGSWLIVALSTDAGGRADWPAYAAAAAAVGVSGVVAATVQRSSTSTYIGVAIMPLVPGFILYTGMLAIAQGDSSTAGTVLADAGILALAIAIGVAIGVGIGRNVIAIAGRLRAGALLSRHPRA